VALNENAMQFSSSLASAEQATRHFKLSVKYEGSPMYSNEDIE
jgi:hypothetical protein